MSGLPCLIETLAQMEDVGENIELIKMEFTNHENYDSDDSFIASESEHTVYGSDSDSDSESDDEDKDEKGRILVKFDIWFQCSNNVAIVVLYWIPTRKTKNSQQNHVVVD